jgi:hypothetical protein
MGEDETKKENRQLTANYEEVICSSSAGLEPATLASEDDSTDAIPTYTPFYFNCTALTNAKVDDLFHLSPPKATSCLHYAAVCQAVSFL